MKRREAYERLFLAGIATCARVIFRGALLEDELEAFMTLTGEKVLRNSQHFPALLTRLGLEDGEEDV